MFIRNTIVGLIAGAAALISLIFASTPALAAPLTLYVSTASNHVYSTDRLVYANPNTPARSITNACQVSQPGDTIEVAPGTYNEDVSVSYANNLLIHPTPGFTSRPVIMATASNNYATVKIDGSNNITFTGFEVSGINGQQNCGGILVVPRTNTAVTPHVITPCHGITVSNCVVHDAGGGIGSNIDSTYTVGNDYNTFIGNIIYKCLNKSIYDGSGMGLHGDQINPAYPNTAGYHSIIANNIIHDNLNTNTDLDANGKIDASKHTDGNGIIIDTNKNGPAVLIQNNVVYHNSGRGIHVFYSDNVTVLNNTVYDNNQDPYLSTGGGELTAGTASNILFSNNVVHGTSLGPAFRVGHVNGIDPATGKGYVNGTIVIKNTTYTGCAEYPTTNTTDITETHKVVDTTTTTYSDPAWGSLFVNPAAGDFHLLALPTRDGLTSLQSQTALNQGSSATGYFATDDFNGVIRVPATGTSPGGQVDKGAYEQSGQVSIVRGGYRYQRSNGHVFQAITLTAAGGNAEGPISVILDGLTGASLVNSAGTTSAALPAGSPFVNAAALLSDASGSTVLEFSTYPTGYTTRTVAGSTAR